MKGARSQLLAGLLSAAVVAVYAVIAHYSSANDGQVGSWAAVVALAPVVLAAAGFARRNTYGILIWLAAAVAAGLLAWAWPWLQRHVAWLYFLQHIGANGALCLLFGVTLIAPRQPLCTVIAGIVHPRMTPLVARYTRQVTVAWTVFFAAMVAVSVILFAFAPVEVWSVFANLLTFPLVGLMFVVENEVRKRLIPPEDRVGLVEAATAFRTNLRRTTGR